MEAGSEIEMAMVETDRRSARKAQTRSALMQAGRRLFARAPVDAVSIDAVVAEAATSKGSFYNHFADRQALVEAVVEDIRTSLNCEVEQVNKGEADAARRLARAVCIYFRYALHEPEGAGALARIHGSHISIAAPYNRPLIDDLGLGLASGRFNIPTLECGVMLVIGVVQVGMQRILTEPTMAVANAQQLVMMILRALAVGHLDAELIAAQAANEIVRARIADDRPH